MTTVNREYKDRVFRFLFGNPENREWTLALYNAINGSNYDNPDDIQFNTIEDAVYLGMKNDASFIIVNSLSLWEHQSSYNPNVPMRFFIYAAKLYEKYIATSDYNPYSSKLQKVPCPKCICFYNGTEGLPEKKLLRLSKAFDCEADIEVKVTMLNINYGKNRQLMEACKPLYEYAWLVDAIRRHQDKEKNLEAAIDAALTEMPEDFLIRSFLLSNKAEVKGMFLTEYNQEKVLEQERLEAINDDRRRVARDMLMDGKPLNEIKKYSRLTEDVIYKLAKTLGIMVM